MNIRKFFYFCAVIAYIAINNYIYVTNHTFILNLDFLFMNAFILVLVHILYAYLFGATMYVGGAILESNKHKCSRSVTFLLAIVISLLVVYINLKNK